MDAVRQVLVRLEPQTGREEEWSQACDRLEAYLLVLGVQSSLRRHQLVLALLAEAMARHRENPARSPTELLLSFTLERVQKWLADEEGLAVDQWEQARRLLILYLTGGPQIWPKAAVEEKTLLVPRKLASSLLPGPEVVLSHMASQPLDYGPLATIAKEAWEDVSWKDVLVALLFWAAVFLCGYFFWLRHA